MLKRGAGVARVLPALPLSICPLSRFSIKVFKLNESQDWGEIQSEPPLKVDRYAGVRYVTFNGTGDTIVAGCENVNIFSIDTTTSQVREPPLTGHASAVRGVACSADGQWLIAGFGDGMIRLLDAQPRGGTVVSAV